VRGARSAEVAAYLPTGSGVAIALDPALLPWTLVYAADPTIELKMPWGSIIRMEVNMRPERLGKIGMMKSDDQQDDRLLSAFSDRREPRANKKLALTDEMISEYWSDRRKTQHEVIIAFYAKFKEENVRRHELREAPPAEETLRDWINASGNHSNVRSKFGEAASRARLKARAL
jgi:hypothetical protein